MWVSDEMKILCSRWQMCSILWWIDKILEMVPTQMPTFMSVFRYTSRENGSVMGLSQPSLIPAHLISANYGDATFHKLWCVVNVRKATKFWVEIGIQICVSTKLGDFVCIRDLESILVCISGWLKCWYRELVKKSAANLSKSPTESWNCWNN